MSTFDWFQNKTFVTNPTRRLPQYPISRDWTDQYNVNYELTSGLYYNSYPGLKLAGGLAFPPIAVPVWFMGFPIVKPIDDNDEQLKKIILQIENQFKIEMQQNHIQCHREGTNWIWPNFSKKNMSLNWEFIRDDVVPDIVRDLATGEILQIYTDEDILISTGYNKKINVRRQRIFEKDKITVKYVYGASQLIGVLKDKTSRNPLNIMPIPFANNAEASMVRGHSDYERTLSDLKNYHDIDLAWSNLLAKFNPKMVQQISQSVDQWKTNNGFSTVGDIDIQNIDLLFNLYDQEKTEFIFPEAAHDAYSLKLKQVFRKIVEGSGIPEIFWGLKTEGNRASVQESMMTGVKYVHDKQDQKNNPYLKLFTASIKLLSTVYMQQRNNVDIEITWNELDAISDETRAEIFKNFAQGIGYLMSNVAIDKETLHKFLIEMYPDQATEKYDDFIKGLSDMAEHKVYSNSDYNTIMDDLTGGSDEDETDNNIINMNE